MLEMPVEVKTDQPTGFFRNHRFVYLIHSGLVRHRDIDLEYACGRAPAACLSSPTPGRPRSRYLLSLLLQIARRALSAVFCSHIFSVMRV